MKRSNETSESAILLLSCQDQTGLVAAITKFLAENNGNIIDLHQHVDETEQIFLMRAEWDLNGFHIPREKISEYFQTLVAEKFGMKWQLYFSDRAVRTAIFCSRLNHCLHDILSRVEAGQWPMHVPLIISNHEELRPVAERAGIPYYCLTIDQDNKKAQEAEQIRLLQENEIELVILARYMQILSADFLNKFSGAVINIHHSFLPAFPGGKPYHAAHSRGVKIIGATSHYATAELDAGPIIEQDVTRIRHTDEVSDFIRKGQDLEKVVLARAVYAHITRKVLVYGNRTAVFD